MNLKLRNPLAFFDLETTGIDIVNDRIVEISIVKLMPNGERIIRTDRVNPERPIPKETSLIHGIYNEDVKDKPTFKEIAKQLVQFLEGADLAGFNVLKFDIPLLMEEFLRVGVDFRFDHKKVVDAQRIFHLMEPRTLSAAYKFYCGQTLDNAHSAEADTIATLEVLDAQVARYEGVQIKDAKGNVSTPVVNDIGELHKLTMSSKVDLAGRMVYNDKGQAVFNFGKHKGKRVLDVLQNEPSYYDWMMKGDFPRQTKQKLTELKLKLFQR